MKRSTGAGAWGAAGAALIIATGMLAGPSTGKGTAASHVDSPRLILDPQMDGSDLYAHTCPDDPSMVCIITNYAPIQQGIGPAFATDARYEVHIDQRGTGTPDLTYRWTFARPEGALQGYTLERIRRGGSAETLVANGVAPVGPSSAGRAEAVAALPGGGRTLAAKAADSFFSNGHHVGLALTGSAIIPSIDLIKVLDGNVNAMVLQVPKNELALGGDAARNPVIGLWATASRKTLDGNGYRQLSRMGNPSMDIVTFFSMGEKYNTMKPTEDRGNAALTGFVRYPKAPGLIKLQNWSVKVPPTPRDDLWQVYFTGIHTSTGPIRGTVKDDLNAHVMNADVDPSEVIPCDELRLNMGVKPARRPNRYGLLENDAQGFPNGRRLGDDIHGMTVRMLMGEPAGSGAPSLLVSYGDKVSAPSAPVTSTFPYLAEPHRI